MDLLSVVVRPTWREFLLDLVNTQQMDPWDIDLVAVADAYLQKVRELQSLDLRVPANVILASALLLRFKADALQLEEPEPEEFYEEPALIAEDIPDLVLRSNRPRSRRLTLEELVAAVEQVMKEGPKRPIVAGVPKILNIELPKLSMEERMQHVYDLAHSLKDSEGVVLFSRLLQESSHNGGTGMPFSELVSYNLLPVLHLVQEQKMLAWQDALFGEIFIKLGDPAQLAAHQAAAQLVANN